MDNKDAVTEILETEIVEAAEPSDTYLKASDPSTWKKKDDETWGDKFLRPDKPLNQRQRELARLAAHGKTNNEIAEQLNYSAPRVSVLLTNTKIKKAISEYRDRLFSVDAETRMKDLLPDAFDAIEAILKSDDIEASNKENAARWLVEKVTGKATQQVDVNAEVSIGALYDKIDNMSLRDVAPSPAKQAQLKESGHIIDVIPTEELEPVEEADDFDSWLDNNL